MAISDELKAQILRYHFVEHWRVGTIASQFGVHHYTVERVLTEAGVERERQRQRRASKLDPYLALITETLERFPTLTAARLFDMVKARGYPGGPDHFRHCIAQLRPRRPREAYLRLRTLLGEQAQIDWAHFGKLTIGRAERPLMAFVLVLSYSRYPFVRFYLNASLASLIRGHVAAFSALGGTARTALYDDVPRNIIVEWWVSPPRAGARIEAKCWACRCRRGRVAPHRARGVDQLSAGGVLFASADERAPRSGPGKKPKARASDSPGRNSAVASLTLFRTALCERRRIRYPFG